MAMPLIFGAVVSYLVLSEQMGETDGNEILLYLPTGLLLAGLPLSSMLYKNSMKNTLNKEADFRNRLSALQAGHLIRMSLVELSSLSAGVVCLLTGNLFNLGIIALVALIFLKNTPTIFYLETEIGLSPNEKLALQ